VANKNARVIIPFAVVVWALFILVFSLGAPASAQAALIGAFAAVTPVIVFYLMSEMGWSTLARRFRASRRFGGKWQACPTAQVSLVSVGDADYERRKLRLVGGTLRLATDEQALHLSMLLSRVPLLGRFFPDLAIPWAAITSARGYEAPGWFKAASEPGTLLQLGFDPNYTGRFLELVAGEPPVYLQLPAAYLGDAVQWLPAGSIPDLD
jgi:hypothetical protein